MLLKIKLRRFYTNDFVPCPRQITPFLQHLRYYAHITPFLQHFYTNLYYAALTTFLHNTFYHFTPILRLFRLFIKVDHFIIIRFCPNRMFLTNNFVSNLRSFWFSFIYLFQPILFYFKRKLKSILYCMMPHQLFTLINF